MSLFDDLPHSVTIYGPPTVSQDEQSGADVISWPLVRAANVPCLISQGPASERAEFSQSQRPRSGHTIAFAGDNTGNIQVGDKLVDDYTGAVYRYTGDRPQQGVGGIDDFLFITVTELS